ncbi:ComF family protein [Flavobacterium gawalongense]|uniref:ComF family protein n=1 Tax=Flavobacterium gawalongense TaxID=2594432 RepID=A0A553BTR3_9FLAO|nr:ComF family protein [Flavobacterium gawalongense]TRX11643.1 ComF family protein [Flavobacterium gawalongense]TRX12354.1 ComF family protein [Flavobacterium gawalongense]TRX30380.1 ComF family protein [Flavobacterium gawalongense]
MFESVINLFFPKVCSGCSSFLVLNENVICTVCRHDIPLTNHHLNPENDAFKKFYGRIPVLHTSALFYFHKKGIVQELIHNLKYKGHEEIGTIVGEWYAEDLKNIQLLQSVDEIIPVPLHRKKLKERGYNQVTAFGEALSSSLNLVYNDSLLIRNVYSKTQSKKNLLGRTEGIKTVFDVSFTAKDHHKHFLLIDDVITTGATLEACSHALLKIPGAKISVICMAMAQS